MANQLLDRFDEVMADVRFDLKLVKRIYQYQIWYINHNREHLEFFGGNLLGVQTVRFKPKDILKFYDEVLDVDFQLVTEAVKSVTSINHDFKISSDVFNLTCMYLIHRFMAEKSLSDRAIRAATQDMALIFYYRCVAAWLSDKIPYPIDPKIAQATYANLSNKFLIKKLGSWYKLMLYRAEDLTKKGGLHYDKLLRFNDDEDIVKVINDSQGRIRDYLKNYYNEFKMAHRDGQRIGTTSSTMIDVDGEETTRDKTRSVESLVTTVRTLLTDKNSFVRDDLLKVISKINTNSSYRIIKTTLDWMVDNYSGKDHTLIDEFAATTVIHSAYLMDINIDRQRQRDLGHVLLQLKNLYLSTRSTDKDLLKIRVLGEKVLIAANGNISKSLMLSTRTAVVLYITLITLVYKT